MGSLKMKFGKISGRLSVCIGIVVLTAVALFGFSGCGNSTQSDSLDSYTEDTTSVYENLVQEKLAGGADDAADVDTTPINIKISDGKLAEFEKYISEIDVLYDYEDGYNVNSALAEYNKNTKNTVKKHSHDIRLNGKFDADHFYEIVKKNNKAFLEEKEKEHSEQFYEEYSNSELKKICEQFCEVLPEIAEKDPTVDLDMACCYLYDIRIVRKKSSLDFGGFDMEKRFYLNYDNMDDLSFAMETDNIEETTFYHEMMHAFQFACDDIKRDDEDRMGVIHSYDGLDVNALSWYWLLEASAEMNMSQHLGVRYSTYGTLIGYAHTLNVVTNINTDGEYVQVEKICNQKDLEKFFDLFDANTLEEKKEIIKMMYSIEIMQQSKDDFYDWYTQNKGVDIYSDDSVETQVVLTVKEDALLTLTKIFYRNLARRINAGDVTLQDAYYLMRLYEADLNRHFANNRVGYMEFFSGFYDVYVELQDEFFKVLAEENGLSAETLTTDFENYSMNAIEKSPNCDLKFLCDSAKAYYTEEYIERYYKKGYLSIRECQQKAKELNEKYPFDKEKVSKVLSD